MQGAKVVSEDRTPSWWGDQVLTKRPLLTISKKDPPVLEFRVDLTFLLSNSFCSNLKIRVKLKSNLSWHNHLDMFMNSHLGHPAGRGILNGSGAMLGLSISRKVGYSFTNLDIR